MEGLNGTVRGPRQKLTPDELLQALVTRDLTPDERADLAAYQTEISLKRTQAEARANCSYAALLTGR